MWKSNLRKMAACALVRYRKYLRKGERELADHNFGMYEAYKSASQLSGI